MFPPFSAAHLVLHLLQEFALGSNLLLDGVVDVQQNPVAAVLVRLLQRGQQLHPPLVRVFLPAFLPFFEVLVFSLFTSYHLSLQHLQPGKGKRFS